MKSGRCDSGSEISCDEIAPISRFASRDGFAHFPYPVCLPLRLRENSVNNRTSFVCLPKDVLQDSVSAEAPLTAEFHQYRPFRGRRDWGFGVQGRFLQGNRPRNAGSIRMPKAYHPRGLQLWRKGQAPQRGPEPQGRPPPCPWICGKRRSAAAVMTPSVPSAPTSKCLRS